jgi:uncharacterized repeat protein (TIGR02543 family)
MKRVFALLLAALLLLGMAACGEGENTTVPSTATKPTQPTQPTQTVPPTTQTTPTEPATTTGPVTLEVFFDAGEGVVEETSMQLPVGEAYPWLPEAVRENYVFLGWFTEPAGGEKVEVGMEAISSEDHTLYAHWEVKTLFTVKLDANGGRISPYNDHVLRKNGETYGDLPTPIREGYTFLGWYTDPEKGTKVKTSTKFSGNADGVLYAHWEYDPLAYWRHVLDTTVQQIPQCRRVVVYLERNAGYKTYIDCPFLDDAGAINPAVGLEHYKVTDEWIKSVNPYIIVKLTTDTGMSLVSKTGMLRRFPDAEIYVFSTSAVSGNDNYQLYCRLYLAKLLYPEYFEDVDLDVVKKELKVKATVYY